MKTRVLRRKLKDGGSKKRRSIKMKCVSKPRRSPRLLQKIVCEKKKKAPARRKDKRQQQTARRKKSRARNTSRRRKTARRNDEDDEAIPLVEILVPEVLDELIDNFWRMAEQPLIALDETLRENEELHERILLLKKQNEICKEMLDESKGVVDMLTGMINEMSENSKEKK